VKELRIVIADDSALMRDYIRQSLSNVPGLVAVGEAVDGAQAFWLYHQMEPNVIVLDLNMPGANGLEVLTAIRKTDQETVIIMFSADPALALRDACLQAGANFYLDKSELPSLVDICRQLQE
jgi:Response regulator containing a CheY-like receiver domain and an HTH DNA-binding domain